MLIYSHQVTRQNISGYHQHVILYNKLISGRSTSEPCSVVPAATTE